MKPENDHSRVTPEGRQCGEMLVRCAEPGIKALEALGEPDERCKSCAFRLGTVPNGCIQTMRDATKAVMEQIPFVCHVDRYPDGERKICHGWYAMRFRQRQAGQQPMAVPWAFSPDDDEVQP